jgi:hypothetical protein
MFAISTLSTFLVASIAIILVPGPAQALVLARTISDGACACCRSWYLGNPRRICQFVLLGCLLALIDIQGNTAIWSEQAAQPAIPADSAGYHGA